MSGEYVVLRVGKDTDVGKLAKSIEMTAREQEGAVSIRAMGAFAVNQAVKALIVARQSVLAQGDDLEWTADFDSKEEAGESITVLVFEAYVVA